MHNNFVFKILISTPEFLWLFLVYSVCAFIYLWLYACSTFKEETAEDSGLFETETKKGSLFICIFTRRMNLAVCFHIPNERKYYRPVNSSFAKICQCCAKIWTPLSQGFLESYKRGFHFDISFTENAMYIFLLVK